MNAEECLELTTLKTETGMFAITVAGNACSKKSRHRLGDFSCYAGYTSLQTDIVVVFLIE